MTRSEWPEKLSLFTASALRHAGNSPEHIQTLVRRGKIIRIGRGVYVRAATARIFGATPDGEHVLRAAAALVQFGRGAVVSHQSAAVLWGIDLIAKPSPDVTITGPPSRGRNGNPSLHVYTTPLAHEHMTLKFGVPVTTAARTVIDLARTMSFVDGVVAADSAIRRGFTSKSKLSAMLATRGGRRGVVRARSVVEFASGLAESVLESIARVVFAEQGLPTPQLQVWISTPSGEVIGRTDFCWEEHKTIAEVDGALKYEDPGRARAQLTRDKRLREAGYEVVHFTWYEITTRPDEVAASIRAAFRAAAARKAA